MGSRYLLSPAMAAFVERSQGFVPRDGSLAALRDAYAALCAAFPPPRPGGLEIDERRLADVPVRIYRPANAVTHRPGVLYLHGGGWTLGGLDSHDFLTAELALALQAVVIAMDYRLAPEHPFPAAFDDCRAVWHALHTDASAIGLDPARIAVAGDSAGGNLAAALCLALRDGGEALPCAQALIYPALGANDLPSRHQCADAPLLSRDDLLQCLAHYLPDPQQHRNPYAMPLAATDFAGLPPAFIGVAEFDPLHDDGLLYRDRLRDAGVPVRFHPGHGLVHGCLRARGQAFEVDDLFAELLAALRLFLR